MQWKQEHSAPHYVEEIGTVHLLTCQNVKVAAVLLSSGAVETAVRRRRALGEDLHSSLPADTSVQHYMREPIKQDVHTVHVTEPSTVQSNGRPHFPTCSHGGGLVQVAAFEHLLGRPH